MVKNLYFQFTSYRDEFERVLKIKTATPLKFSFKKRYRQNENEMGGIKYIEQKINVYYQIGKSLKTAESRQKRK